MSEFWHRYWQRLSGARPRPEPAALKAADANAAVLEARAEITQLRTEVGQANADAASLRQEAMRLREDNRDLRDGVAKAQRAQGQDAASIAALTDRAEQAEATAASLRDDNARLARSVITAGDALRQIADAPTGTTHAVKTTLAATGLAALSDDAGEVPAGAQEPSEGRAEGFLA